MLRTKLEDLARRARAHAPAPARGLIQRLEDAYRARRHAPPEPAPPPPPPAAPEPRRINWELRPASELIDHIEQHHHAGLRRELPRLIDAARRLERAHASHPALPAGLADLLVTFAAELESHMHSEEQVLFPTLRGGARGGDVDMPIRMMQREHDSHADALEQIRDRTDSLTAPASAPPEWTALYDGLEALESELRQHIYLEDNVLFARATGR